MATQTKQDEIVDYDLVAQAKEQARLMMKQFTQNEITLGATIVDIKAGGGNPIIDRDTKEQMKDNDGNLRFYPVNYSVVLTFKGGEIETKITDEQKEHLKIGIDYSCRGRLAPVKKFGNVEILPVFHTFIEL